MGRMTTGNWKLGLGLELLHKGKDTDSWAGLGQVQATRDTLLFIFFFSTIHEYKITS